MSVDLSLHPSQAEGRDPPAPSVQPPRTSPNHRSRTPPRRVDHTYRDYSHFTADELPARKKSAKNFPSKLHHILSTHEFAHIISWMPHGRCWKIHDRKRFVREVVPLYFIQSKYESFSRQLNGWGFKRLHQSGNDFDAYYHECFVRGLPHLTALMKRVPSNQGKLIPHVEGEPNFYEIDRQFPLPPPAHSMPYQGHYPYSPGHGTPPELPTSYHCPEHYAPYPNSYPPPPPQYYFGHPDPTGAAAAYSAQPGYPPHPFHATQHTQPYVQHQTDSPAHPCGAPPYFLGPPTTNGAGPVKSEEVSWGVGGTRGERIPAGEERRGDCLEPWSVVEEVINATTDCEHNSGEEQE